MYGQRLGDARDLYWSEECKYFDTLQLLHLWMICRMQIPGLSSYLWPPNDPQSANILIFCKHIPVPAIAWTETNLSWFPEACWGSHFFSSSGIVNISNLWLVDFSSPWIVNLWDRWRCEYFHFLNSATFQNLEMSGLLYKVASDSAVGHVYCMRMSFPNSLADLLARPLTHWLRCLLYAVSLARTKVLLDLCCIRKLVEMTSFGTFLFPTHIFRWSFADSRFSAQAHTHLPYERLGLSVLCCGWISTFPRFLFSGMLATRRFQCEWLLSYASSLCLWACGQPLSSLCLWACAH